MAEELKTIETVDLSPFKCMVMTIGELPSSFVESMTYYEALAWLDNYIEKTLIPTINNNAEAVQELQALYIELHDYVENYFDNLDVQEEIDNKLDAMAEAGTLEEIIGDYLNSTAVWGFDTVADMKASTNLINGSFAKTLGFYNKNDGGGAFYKIRNITNDDVIDESTIIEIADSSNELIAELIFQNEMTIKQFGAKANGTDNDSTIASIMLSKYGKLNLGGYTVVLQGLTLPIVSTIKNGTVKVTSSGTPFTGHDITSLLVDGVEFQATVHRDNPIYVNNLCNLYDSANITIRNCKINDCACGFNFVNCENIIVHDNEITGTSRFGFNFGADNYIFGYAKNVEFYNNNMHDNPYIPLKFTGYIENINVYGNTGTNNLDSEETACYSFKNVKIHDNVFTNDTFRNIGFKHLDLTEYPLPADAPHTLYAENVEIYNNTCINGYRNGINIQLYYDNNINMIRIHDNTIDSNSNISNDYLGIKVGAFNSSVKDACMIYNNTVNGHNLAVEGIQLINAKNVLITNNNVYECIESCIKITYQAAIYTAYGVKCENIYITDNNLTTLTTTNSRCVLFKAEGTGSDINTDITNIYIIHNNFNVNEGANQVQDKPTLTFISQNYDGTHVYDSAPNRRSANNTIYYAKDPVTSGCVGWIATGSLVTPTYKTYIPIS